MDSPVRNFLDANIVNHANLKVWEPAGNTTKIVVSQTGGGDFKSIAQAIREAEPGSDIHIRSGYYEEALNISKPLTLRGDPNELAVIANSNFAVLRVRNTQVSIHNLALVSGLRMPSLEFDGAHVRMHDSILWALDTFLKRSNPSLMPARALVGESFLGACLRNLFPIEEILTDLLRLAERAPEGFPQPVRGEPNPVPHLNEPPDVVLKAASRFMAANSFIGMASFLARDRCRVEFSDSRLDYASVTSTHDSDVVLSGCDRYGEPWKPRVLIRRGPFPDSFEEIHPSPNPVKREMEASLLLRVKGLEARANRRAASESPGVEPARRTG